MREGTTNQSIDSAPQKQRQTTGSYLPTSFDIAAHKAEPCSSIAFVSHTGKLTCRSAESAIFSPALWPTEGQDEDWGLGLGESSYQSMAVAFCYRRWQSMHVTRFFQASTWRVIIYFDLIFRLLVLFCFALLLGYMNMTVLLIFEY
jgi:hypothetical protein